ncbi:MAG: nucleotidyltransferase domain-containing protein [Anaerolineae bacterium]
MFAQPDLVVPARSAIVERLRSALPAILQSRPVLAAYLYGSVADGHALPDSDVDIALVLLPEHHLSAYERQVLELDVAAEIEEACGIREADVRIINDAPLMAQGIVLTEGIRVFSRDDDLCAEFEVAERKRYFDFLPVVQMMRRAYFQRKGAALRRQGLLRDG